uniref:FGENESH: predicted gene_9.296 protein n=1 Tax=Rhodotorula toruloides TaxID=5286 RepID=A0A0K3CH91_RHOTO
MASPKGGSTGSLHKTDDRTTGQAVYDSVSPLHSLSSRLAERDREEGRVGEKEKAGRRRRRYEDEEEDSDEEDDREERIPVPPIPDLRYEQGVLASIRPFLHRIDDNNAGELQAGEATEKEKKVLTAEKSALASAQLTAEGSSKRESASDVLMAPLRIEWSKVTYVIVRDQVVFPLLQGIAWGVAGFYLSALWDWNKARLAVKKSGNPYARTPSLLASLGIRTR